MLVRAELLVLCFWLPVRQRRGSRLCRRLRRIPNDRKVVVLSLFVALPVLLILKASPWQNNHYTRQQIAHAIPLALSGQRWDAKRQTLGFKFAAGAPARLPFHTPFAMGTVERVSGAGGDVVGLRLTLHAGELRAAELRYDGRLVATELQLGVGTHTV